MIGPYLGLLREGTVRRVDMRNGTMKVTINLSKSDVNPLGEIDVPIIGGWAGPNGEFSGGYPAIGSTVWCGQGQGGRWAALTFAPSNDVFGNKTTSTTTSLQQNLMAALSPGRWVTQVKNNIRIIVDPKIGVQAGNPREYIQLDPGHDTYSNTFQQHLEFSNAARRISGVVKRDLVSNSNRNITGSALTSHIYDEALTPIGLDPKTRSAGSINRNPPFAEVREIIYEFSNSFGFTDDEREISIYDNNDEIPEIETTFNRRNSRADALSLSLVSPNQLIETIKGTVVDIYGNLVDINRSILPSGTVDALSFRNSEGDKSQTFIRLREQSRKSLAYHMEINTRKADVSGFSDLKRSIGDRSDTTKEPARPADYARNRSKFFFDIDKEGQFKMNVPASSEVGNVPLLVRYENYTTLKAVEDDSDPNKFRRNNTGQDIFLEGHGIGVISLVGDSNDLESFSAPTDRINDVGQIQLGTAYHNIQDTLQMHNRTEADPVFFHPANSLNTDVPVTGNVVSPEIIVSGDTANAGGRSGTISLDGFMNISIGANTIDRQSLWMDLAGGMVVNVGRDINNRSYQGRFDGDVLMQVGGATIANDSRFNELNNGNRDGALDIRVVQGGMMTIVRIDNKGVRIATPGGIDIVSRGKMRLKSIDNDIVMDARGIYFYADDAERGRWVQRKPGMTI